MAYIAGVDVGNNTTEVALAEIDGKGNPKFLSSAMVRTVGIKGTLRNAMGIIEALDQALKPVGLRRDQLDAVLLNEATPVIGDIAMETITETVITESAMIGHNPSTPGGTGLGQGRTIALGDLQSSSNHQPYIAIIPGHVEFKDAAQQINAASVRGLTVAGAIVQKDDGVLINNRLQQPIPIVDEVKYIDRVPVGMPAAIEVARPGRTIEKLCNPYDIATLSPPIDDWRDVMSDTATHVSDLAQRLSGTWFNQLGSCLQLHVDHQGRITGLFQSSVGGVDGGHEVSGFVAADPDGLDGAVGFAVSWGPAHSLTVWSGHYRSQPDAIFTTWLLSEASSPHGEWHRVGL